MTTLLPNLLHQIRRLIAVLLGVVTIVTWAGCAIAPQPHLDPNHWLLIKNPRFGTTPSEPEYTWVTEDRVPTTLTTLLRGKSALIAPPDVVARYGAPPGGGKISPRQKAPCHEPGSTIGIALPDCAGIEKGTAAPILPTTHVPNPEMPPPIRQESTVAVDLKGPPGAEVLVDGARHTLNGSGNLSLQLPPGTHEIKGQLAGFMPFLDRLVVAPGKPIQHRLTLTPAPAPTTDSSAPAAAIGERFAVIVGIGTYDHSTIPRLQFAERDAEAIYEVLTTDAGFRKENVLLLTDGASQRPTLRNIKSALGTFLARSTKKEDTVIVFFAGHGAPELDWRGVERDGLTKYLIPSDADPNDLYATALSMDEIQTIFARIDAERLVMFVDSCYSGAAGGRTFISQRVRTRDVAIDGQFLDRLARAKGRAIITASRPSEVSLELSELGHGLFTYYLLAALRGAADADKDGVITLQEVYDYVSRQVAATSRTVGGSQHPVMRGELDGPLPLARIRPR